MIFTEGGNWNVSAAASKNVIGRQEEEGTLDITQCLRERRREWRCTYFSSTLKGRAADSLGDLEEVS